MGKKSRDKGSRFELWLCNEIDQHLGFRPSVTSLNTRLRGSQILSYLALLLSVRHMPRATLIKQIGGCKLVNKLGIMSLSLCISLTTKNQEPSFLCQLSTVSMTTQA